MNICYSKISSFLKTLQLENTYEFSVILCQLFGHSNGSILKVKHTSDNASIRCVLQLLFKNILHYYMHFTAPSLSLEAKRISLSYLDTSFSIPVELQINQNGTSFVTCKATSMWAVITRVRISSIYSYLLML